APLKAPMGVRAALAITTSVIDGLLRMVQALIPCVIDNTAVQKLNRGFDYPTVQLRSPHPLNRHAWTCLAMEDLALEPIEKSGLASLALQERDRRRAIDGGWQLAIPALCTAQVHQVRIGLEGLGLGADRRR